MICSNRRSNTPEATTLITTPLMWLGKDITYQKDKRKDNLKGRRLNIKRITEKTVYTTQHYIRHTHQSILAQQLVEHKHSLKTEVAALEKMNIFSSTETGCLEC